MKKALSNLIFFLLSGWVYGQTIPVGMPVLDDYLRRLQLTGQVDSAVSWMIRPQLPTESFELKSAFRWDSTYNPTEKRTIWYARYGKNGRRKFTMLPLTYRSQYNSEYAFGVNDGVMIPNRGLQQVFSLGAYAEFWKFSLQLQPEFFSAQNLDYLGFPMEHQATILFYYEYMNRIDMPERFGTEPIKRYFPGQSSFRFNTKGLSFGISSENLWWGPSKRNSLLLSNNAPGFWHLTINTRRPIKTAIGSFETQAITGYLNSSGFLPPWPDYSIQQNRVIMPKREDNQRYLSGVILTYQPKWVSGLFFGFASVNQMYRSDLKSLPDYLPVFNGHKKAQNIYDPVQDQRQQFSAGFFRWLSPEGRFEFYGEFGTRDNDRPFNDFITTPESGRAFTFGFTHLVEMKKPNRYLEISSEMTFSGQTIREDIRQLRSWYIHDYVRHGYTHEGQVLGIGNGPGSNQIFAGVAWVEGKKKLGFQIERIEYNNDFYYYRYEESKDFRNKYVDLVFSLTPEWRFGNLLLSGKFQYVYTFNYKWYLENDPKTYFVPGYDRKNFVGHLSLAYLFN